MAERRWTPAQRQAIETRGGSLLVSAAAGSGKTAVLTQRVASLLTDPEHPVDADRILVVTFSNAAAAEMRQRIAACLRELSRENPGDRRLLRQQLLLESAQISTVHAFCGELLRGSFQRLGLPASFRLMQEEESAVLHSRVLDTLLEEEFARADPGFTELVELFSDAGRDARLDRMILDFYAFMRNHPYYDRWLSHALSEYDESRPLSETRWGEILLHHAALAVTHCLALNEQAQRIIEANEALCAAYTPAFAQDRQLLEDCRAAVESRDWNRCREAFCGASFARLGTARGCEAPMLKQAAQTLRQEIKDTLRMLAGKCFFESEEEYRADIALQRPVMERLFGILQEFDRRLKAEKADKGTLDFSDLEHYALELLCGKDGAGETDVALALREKYEEILIDEYQDTNDIQERIFRAISRDGKNIFMVGDVKQSIYRFRQARPELFLQKKENWPTCDGGCFPAKITLNANFRTRREITGFVNDFFSLCMNPTVGEMRYGAEDALFAAADYDYTGEIPVTAALLDPPEGMEGAEAEGRYIAAQIRRLLDGGMWVRDGETTRPLRPSDICILLRAPRGRAQYYTAPLEEAGIPCFFEQGESMLSAPEISPLVSYLKLLFNPLLEMELTEVLLSPMYSLLPEDLAAVRAAFPGEELFPAVRKAAQSGACVFDRFLGDCRLLRSLSMELSGTELLLRLYELTAMPHKVLLMPGGEAREANLRLLLRMLSDFEGTGGDLTGFVSHLYSMEEYGVDLPSASAGGAGAVRLMSIHKSKGLEFPVVFLAGMGSRFNLTDLHADVQLHPELGTACIYRNSRALYKHDTLPRAAMCLENRRAMLSEEMRILYVAMTRAREKLYLVAADRGFKKLSDGWEIPMGESGLSEWGVLSASGWLDWLAAVLCRHPAVSADCPVQPKKAAVSEEGRIELVRPKIAAAPDAAEESRRVEPAVDEQALELLLARERFVYPYQVDTAVPSKVAVSELAEKGGFAQRSFRRRPAAVAQQELTPINKGIALHRFLQFADFARAARDPQAEIAAMRERAFLSPQEADSVDPAAVRAFFDSELGRRILSADRVYREIRFLRRFDAEELIGFAPEFAGSSGTVVQGVADCVFVENGVGTVVDYKTDQVKEAEELARRYAGQLALYAVILESQLGLPIRGQSIYSFCLGREIRLR